jgi:hypothetical protein
LVASSSWVIPRFSRSVFNTVRSLLGVIISTEILRSKGE